MRTTVRWHLWHGRMTLLGLLTLAVVLGENSLALGAKLHVAVFNFQMKSDTREWAWLEKGLADQITTDFTRSQRITVAARDEMQLLARKLRWVPEMALTGPVEMTAIRRRLKIDRLVTGTYAVRKGTVEITAQVVSVTDRKELARRSVSGRLAEVLDLQRRLSAELLAWFTNVPREQILPHLPAWSRSIPATRALYEGMHLYDQGRYGEAWLRFRESWRNDPEYLAAKYWVARMYYFMDRYEHARRAYEQFIYEDSTHPRVGDAIKEYLHTFEKIGTPPDRLLKLYSNFARRFPDVPVYNEMGLPVPLSNRAWLQARSAQVLDRIGQSKRATELASACLSELVARRQFWPDYPLRLALDCAVRHNMRTGQVLIPRGLSQYFRTSREHRQAVRFQEGRNRAEMRWETPMEVPRSQFADGRTWYGWIWTNTWVLAPDGYVFKSLTAYPMVDGKDGEMWAALMDSCWQNWGKRSLAEGRAGMRFPSVPRRGILRLMTGIAGKEPYQDPDLRYRGIRLEAELEKIGSHGSIHAQCENTHLVSVYVDGRHQREGSGLVGLIPVGKHNVQFRPVEERHPYGPSRTIEVEVRKGVTTNVRMSMPWKEGSRWSSWTPGTRLGGDRSVLIPCLQDTEDQPSLLLEDKQMLVFWSHQADIWTARSADGAKFSRATRLPMPVSSGWVEQDPLCLREESGRLLLAFVSDREAQHQSRAYISWSRDDTHWSRPAMVVDRPVHKFDLIQDGEGRLLWADATNKTVSILRSRDAYHWAPLASFSLPDAEHDIQLVQRGDGTFELLVSYEAFVTKYRTWETQVIIVERCVSKDGTTWSPREEIARFAKRTHSSMSAIHVGGRTYVACFLFKSKHYGTVLREREKGKWRRSPQWHGMPTLNTAMGFHPRWGYVFAWRQAADPWEGRAEDGPFLIRAATLDALFAPGKAGPPIESAVPRRPPP